MKKQFRTFLLIFLVLALLVSCTKNEKDSNLLPSTDTIEKTDGSLLDYSTLCLSTSSAKNPLFEIS